jgi:hypothetical protein
MTTPIIDGRRAKGCALQAIVEAVRSSNGRFCRQTPLNPCVPATQLRDLGVTKVEPVGSPVARVCPGERTGRLGWGGVTPDLLTRS